MSSGLAIAAVTAIFKNLLEDGLVQNAALSSMGNILVTTLPPDQISIGVDGQPQLNLFLYQVSQNRNADLGKSDRSAQHQTNTEEAAIPPLAINLHYVLTAYGNKDFQTEILLGYVMQLMHQTSVLSNARIRSALNHIATINRSGLLSQAIESTSVEALTEQLDQVNIVPNLLDTDQMSRLWSLLQGSYRPSIAYEVSIVFVGSQKSSLAPGSNSQVLYQPRIDKVTASPLTNGEIVAGNSLIVYGKNLSDDLTRLRLNGGENLLDPEIVEYNRILFKLPQNLHAGVQRVQVVRLPKYKFLNSQQVMSNEKTFILHPTIQVSVDEQSPDIQEQNNLGNYARTTLTVKYNPIIGKQQQVILKLFSTNKKSDEVFVLDAPLREYDTDTIKFSVQNIPSGMYLVKSQVDGVENLLDINQVMIQDRSLPSDKKDEHDMIAPRNTMESVNQHY